MSTSRTSRTPLVGLVDEAAIFPPGNATVDVAVSDHRRHLQAPYAALLGAFVVSDVALPDLTRTLSTPAPEPTAEPLSVTGVVTGGAGALEPAVRWATGAAELDLRGVKIALRNEADLPHNARRVVAVLDDLVVRGYLDESIPCYVEPPRLHESSPTPLWTAALDVLAARELRLKLRTGGTEAGTFPSAREVACFVEAALDRELPFKCTAGLHAAIRHREPDTGFEHHGFLNLILGTRASLDGAPRDDVVGVLEATDPAVVLSLWEQQGEDALATARSWFVSFGSCSVIDPVRDLVALGLLPDQPDLDLERP